MTKSRSLLCCHFAPSLALAVSSLSRFAVPAKHPQPLAARRRTLPHSQRSRDALNTVSQLFQHRRCSSARLTISGPCAVPERHTHGHLVLVPTDALQVPRDLPTPRPCHLNLFCDRAHHCLQPELQIELVLYTECTPNVHDVHTVCSQARTNVNACLWLKIKMVELYHLCAIRRIHLQVSHVTPMLVVSTSPLFQSTTARSTTWTVRPSPRQHCTPTTTSARTSSASSRTTSS